MGMSLKSTPYPRLTFTLFLLALVVALLVPALPPRPRPGSYP